MEKMCDRTAIIKLAMAAILLVVLIATQSRAQSICTSNELTVFAMRGRVIIGEKEYRFPDALVEINKAEEEDDDKRLVASTTDDNGNFAFPNIKPGRYYISADTGAGIPPYSVPIKLIPRKLKKKSAKEGVLPDIVIFFGDNFSKFCQGNYSELRKVR